MPITLGTNISSLYAQRKLQQATDDLGTIFTRLSSGQRINKSSDDAASLAIAESLKADGRVFTQGIRNVNDGISVLNIADGALNEITNITIRLQELAEQAANGTLSTVQRSSLDTEAQALSDEYFRIVQSTEFNGRKLFDANYGELTLQAGYGSNGSIGQGLGGNVGTGEFLSPTEYAFTTGGDSNILGTELVDLNGDGHLDLVTAGTYDDNTQLLKIQAGDGNGNFTDLQDVSPVGGAAPAVREIASGDINGDGIIDLVGATDELVIYIGNGDGTVQDGVAIAGTTGGSFELGDINNDGNLDLVSAAGIRFGDGAGSFGAVNASFSTFNINDVDIVDVNNDGNLDVVSAGSIVLFDGGFSVFLGDGTGNFQDGIIYDEASSSNTQDLSVSDLNNDGFADIITSHGTVALGNGDGTFNETTSVSSSSEIIIGDINSDGIEDIVYGNGSGLSYREGKGDGTFEAVQTVSEIETSRVTLGDINEDGVLDIVSGEKNEDDELSSVVRVANTVDGVAPLLAFSLKSRPEALEALTLFSQKLSQLTEQRGKVGAFESRLEFAEKVLSVTTENYQVAESRIRDADIALEASRLVRLQVLQQSAAQVLSQVNLQPELVLELLKND